MDLHRAARLGWQALPSLHDPDRTLKQGVCHLVNSGRFSPGAVTDLVQALHTQPFQRPRASVVTVVTRAPVFVRPPSLILVNFCSCREFRLFPHSLQSYAIDSGLICHIG
jgi:hypothetical protein